MSEREAEVKFDTGTQKNAVTFKLFKELKNETLPSNLIIKVFVSFKISSLGKAKRSKKNVLVMKLNLQ